MKTCLQLKANLENVTNLTASGQDFRWYIKFKCNNCGEESDKWVYLSLEEEFPIKGSRGSAHLVTKCKLCSRESSIEILPDTQSMYTSDDSNQFKTIIGFDCRGLSIIDFSPRIGFACESVDSGRQFNDINLEEKEWVDYDEDSRQSVGIYEVEHKFITIK
ncbi:CXXC motif containing zinc binding protein-like isoform X2 [Oppia nitens]|uniref:CXXC motif containing zinc binding protein-like isoform X2 n=1 Tax=Oppia nitens TaxID=1686743 RepID=UPI0023DB793F|nr:CXXC motif containing zinc binding protein-like isoform X2 [Oppia nitens]